MDIILVRHGQSLSNVSKVYGGRDVGLSPKGILQAKKSKIPIGKLDFKKVYVSPMKRALETMDYLGLNGQVEEDLREIDLGILEGHTYEDFMKKYPKEGLLWTNNPISYALPKGENVIDLYTRVKNFFDKLINNDENVILICHDGVIKAGLSYVFEDYNYFFRFKTDNLGVSMITINKGFKYINFQNRIFY